MSATRAFIQIDFRNRRGAITDLKIDRGTVTDLRTNPTNPAIKVGTRCVNDRFQRPWVGANVGHQRQTVIVATIDAFGAKSATRVSKVDHWVTLLIVLDNPLGAAFQAGVTTRAKLFKLRVRNCPGRMTLVRIAGQLAA